MPVKFRDTININASYTLPATDGSADQVIKTDGSGNLSFTNQSSGGSQLSVEKNILTGDGSTVTFSVSSSIVSENNTQVYIDGVYQSKDNYSTSGSNITFSTAPPNAAEIEVIQILDIWNDFDAQNKLNQEIEKQDRYNFRRNGEYKNITIESIINIASTKTLPTKNEIGNINTKKFKKICL